VRTIAAQLTAENSGRRNVFEGHVKPLRDQVSGRVRLAVWVLAGAVGLVMLIVCANLSNLLLARTAARQKEIAIRTALGAGRGRLLAQMLTEGIVLSCSGAVVGFALAVAGTRALAGLEAVSIPLLREVRTDFTALAFTLGIAMATGIVFGLAPALQGRGAALTNALKDATRGSTEDAAAPGFATRWWWPRSPSPASSSSAPACSYAASCASSTWTWGSCPSRRWPSASIPTGASKTRNSATRTTTTSCGA
jgi:hypothetical protein